jgi:hypothetical protein
MYLSFAFNSQNKQQFNFNLLHSAVYNCT